MRKLSMRTKEGYTVTEALDNFLRKCTTRNLSQNTITMYSVRLRVFQGFLNGSGDNMPITGITKDVIDDYTIFLKESGSRNAVSVNSYLRDLGRVATTLRTIPSYKCICGDFLLPELSPRGFA
ncbi:MAG: phage integrase SAM-like domain-containing protein [Defluviitaleaceae bacterium]|nr:phage integrase SAM-like domain-containing protein [Defluviitaleaceae bacterium]